MQYLNAGASKNEAKIFSPMIDAQALLEAPVKTPRLAFMNALDVEEYLRSKGAAHLDQEFIQIETVDIDDEIDNSVFDSTPPENRQFDFDFSELATHAIQEETFAPSLAGSGQLDQFGFPKHSWMSSEFEVGSFSEPQISSCGGYIEASIPDVSGNVLDSFDIDALQAGTLGQHGSTEEQVSRRQRTLSTRPRTTTLRRSTLLESLPHICICLGTGPGYPTEYVDMAIKSAIC